MKLINRLKMVLAATLLLGGCSGGSVSPVGVWSNVQTPETVEFKADKSGVFVVKDHPSLAFNWVPIDHNRVKVDINFHGTVQTLLGRVEGDNFILEGTRQRATYSRVKQ